MGKKPCVLMSFFTKKSDVVEKKLDLKVHWKAKTHGYAIWKRKPHMQKNTQKTN